jgi:subtilisin family serine protease
MAPRGPALLAIVILLAVPLSGCTGITTASTNGYGEGAWTLKMIQADRLHDQGLSGKGVKVAIIDTGIDLNHDEFRGVSIEWADLVNGKRQAYDDNGHGSHVAGIVAAQGIWKTMFNGYRLRGVAPGVSLIVIKAIDASGHGDEGRVAQGVTTAVSAGANVIVLSLGGDTRPIFGTNTESAVRQAIAHGVFVVAAAGNVDKDAGETSCTVTSPASVEGVIAVGAVARNESIASFSCHGTGRTGGGGTLVGGIRNPDPGNPSRDPDRKPEVVAPGVDITSAWKEGGYAIAQGTSQAAPMVGGVLALLLEKRPDLKSRDGATVEMVKTALSTSAKKIGPLAGQSGPVHDDAYGYGLVQADALLRAVP